MKSTHTLFNAGCSADTDADRDGDGDGDPAGAEVVVVVFLLLLSALIMMRYTCCCPPLHVDSGGDATGRSDHPSWAAVLPLQGLACTNVLPLVVPVVGVKREEA